MFKLLKIFWCGMCISFLGTLPLGTVNVTATNITVHNSVQDGFLFSAGCMLVETICLCFVLVTMDWISRKQKVFKVFEWLTVLLILVMATGSFIAAYKMQSFGENVFTAYNLNPFLLGIILSSLNPLHIPFWIGWTTVLINKKVITPSKENYILYAAGITIGAFAGFALFIYGGKYIIVHAANNQQLINWIVGLVLFVTAIVQLYKMIWKPVIVREVL